MGLESVTPPSGEPVSLEEAKIFLRVDSDDEDQLIARLVSAAREMAERHTRRAFLTQDWLLWRDCWPSGADRGFEIPKPPLLSVTSVTAYDRSGAAITLAGDAYIVDSAAAPGRIVLKETASLPAFLREANAIGVAFRAGYGDGADDVPAAIRQAVLLIAAQLYESRGAVAGGLPDSALALLAPFRVVSL